MDIRKCYEELGGSYEEVSARLPSLKLIERFIGKFLEDKSYYVLCEQMKCGNRKEAFLAAHTLKGVSANLGFTALERSSSKLTEELRGEGEGITAVACELMIGVERDYSATVRAIRNYLNQ